MDGLINQARAQLWRMVTEFTKASHRGVRPKLEVALFEYGNDGLPASEGYTRLIEPFTHDLDEVSRELFALRTNGGSEFCGWVIDRAVRTLDWSGSSRDLRCIFIAGNEPFTQGPKDAVEACSLAASKGITVTTIHCGDYHTGVNTGWQQGARLADGSFLNIDQNQTVTVVETPHDKELAELSIRLNVTYVPYGAAKKRVEAIANQVAQDNNASNFGVGNAASRAQVKASAEFYQNFSWDLVDGCRVGHVKLEDLKPDQLPEELRKLSLGELQAYVEKRGEERRKIQDQIKNLSANRDKFIAEYQARQASQPQDKSLAEAVIKAVREQASRRDYKFDE
jgi:hypothetical protein